MKKDPQVNTLDRMQSNGFKLHKIEFQKRLDEIGFRIVVEEWNRLSEHVIKTHFGENFKGRLDKFIDRDVRWT